VVRPGGSGVGEVGNPDIDGDNGQNTTASDPFEVKGVVGAPKSSHVKSVLRRHVPTGHVPYHSRGFYNSWKWGNATHVSSYRLQRDEYLYGTDTAKTAWSSRQTSIRQDSRPQWPSNGSRERQSKNGVHSSVCGTYITGPRIGGASRAYAGLLIGFRITLVPVQES
jgi:hypothetical protein